MRRASAVVVVAALLLVIAVLVLRREPKEEQPLRRRRAAVAVEEGVRPEPLAPLPKPASADLSVPKSVTSTPAATPVHITPPTVIPSRPGVIRGTVRLGAAPPRPKRLPMDTDPYCAQLHAEPMFSEKIVADVNLGVKWAFVYVMQGAPPPGVSTVPVILSQEGCVFKPHVLGIQVGQPLMIRNDDPHLHSVHANAFANPCFSVGQMHGTPALKKIFQREEVMVSIRCDIHPWMQAWVGVLEHQFFAVTDAAGAYVLPPLPAGHYTVGVWHEAYETVGRPVDLPGEETTSVDFLLDARK